MPGKKKGTQAPPHIIFPNPIKEDSLYFRNYLEEDVHCFLWHSAVP